MSHFEEIKEAFLKLDKSQSTGYQNEKPARTTFEQTADSVIITFDTLDTDNNSGYHYKKGVPESLKASGPRQYDYVSGQGVTISGGDGHVIKIEETSQYRDDRGKIVKERPTGNYDDTPKYVITIPDNEESVFKINAARRKSIMGQAQAIIDKAREEVREIFDKHLDPKERSIAEKETFFKSLGTGEKGRG